jgi:hypothetical protein
VTADFPSDSDRRAIEHDCARLIALYANLSDEGRWEEVAELFVEHGTLVRPAAPDQPIVGRQAILAAFRARPARIARHVCSNVVIDVDGQTSAGGVSAMLLFSGSGAPLVGSYHDRFCLVEAGWRFLERRGSLTFRS